MRAGCHLLYFKPKQWCTSSFLWLCVEFWRWSVIPHCVPLLLELKLCLIGFCCPVSRSSSRLQDWYGSNIVTLCPITNVFPVSKVSHLLFLGAYLCTSLPASQTALGLSHLWLQPKKEGVPGAGRLTVKRYLGLCRAHMVIEWLLFIAINPESGHTLKWKLCRHMGSMSLGDKVTMQVTKALDVWRKLKGLLCLWEEFLFVRSWPPI